MDSAKRFTFFAPGAASLLGELEEPPQGLRARVEGGLREHAAEADRLRRLERLGDDMDLDIGRRTRLFVLGVLGILWTLYPLWSWLHPGSDVGYGRQIAAPSAFLVVAVALGWFGRESLGRTLVNRRLFAALVSLLLSQMLLTGICWWHDVPREALATLLFFLWFGIAALVTQLVEKRLWPTALGQLCGLVAVACWPPAVYAAIAATNAIFVANILIIWWPGNIRGTYDGDARVR